jgi:hypothetical protein
MNTKMNIKNMGMDMDTDIQEIDVDQGMDLHMDTDAGTDTYMSTEMDKDTEETGRFT